LALVCDDAEGTATVMCWADAIPLGLGVVFLWETAPRDWLWMGRPVPAQKMLL
jgi:hypothetical protein